MQQKKSDKQRLQLEVGAFLIGGLTLIVVAIFILGAHSGYFKKQYHLYAYFDDISGLSVGSRVNLAGVTVGSVESITFEKHATSKGERALQLVLGGPTINSGGTAIRDTGVKVRVNLNIDARYKDRIRTDSVASITTMGLLGDSLIYITVGDDQYEKLQDGNQIVRVIKAPNSIEQLKLEGKELIVQSKDILKTTKDIVNNFDAVLKRIRDGHGLAHEVIYNDEAGKIVARANLAVEHLDMMTQNFANISRKIDDGQGTLGKFVNDPGVYNDLKTLLGKANRNKLVRSVIRYTLATHDADQSK